MSASEAAEALLDIHRSVELANSADFLIATLDPRLSLMSIKDGSISDGPIGSVGSHDAYRAYRALEIGETPPGPIIRGYAELGKERAVSFSEMRSAMKHLIAAAAIEDVGGFAIAVTNDGTGFNYAAYADAWFPPIKLPRGEHILPFGTAAEGGYAYDVLATDDRRGVFSYFLQGASVLLASRRWLSQSRGDHGRRSLRIHGSREGTDGYVDFNIPRRCSYPKRTRVQEVEERRHRWCAGGCRSRDSRITQP
jgi:hypothetical protein